VVKFITSP